jgi:T5SS/PEP-CTERM-associated repeat protein
VTFNPALALPADYYLANATTIEAHPGAGMPVRGVTIGAEANDTAAVLVSHLSILQAVAATLGHASGSSGTLTLNQNNDQFNVTGSNASDTELIIGRLGTGVLDVSVGADVNVNGALGNAALGKSAGSNGTAKISGSGSTFNVVGTLAVGDGGNGILNVTAGGDVVNTTALIGAASGSIGEVHIGGVGTTWTNSASLYVGFNGQGSLDIDGEARVTTATGYIGTHPNSTGVATVTGGGSMLTATGDLFIGNSGSGTLEVTNGGDVVVDDNSFIGTGDDTSGAVTIDGNGSTWTNSGGLVVGSEGSGTLMVSGGGVVESLNGLIGYNPGSMGDTTVDGSGSTWTHSGGLFVGGQGSGTLMVSGGGVVESGTGYVGYHPGSMGNTTVDGSGSTWMNSGGLGVGYQGSGMLTIQNDGAVEVAGQVDVGVDNVGVMSVDNATATVAGYFHIGGSNLGGDGDGTLNITGGGTVTSLNFCDVGRWVGSTGHVHVSGAGSTWHTGPLSVGEQANGTLVITGGAQVVSGVIEGTGSDIGRTTDAVGAVTVDGIGSQWSISESLMVGIDGSGTLTVSNGGIVAAPNVVVNSASALRGDGLVAGNVQNGGLVSPGLSAGALSINGDYAQTTAGKLLIELSATSYDQLVVTDSASLAGTLEINLVDGFVPSIGQSWIILTADDLDDVTDTFNTEMLPSVPNLAFDVIYNAQSVVLTVMSALPGDYNLDGSVDAADYVVWRKTDGTQAGFDLWRAHFGETAGGGAGAAVETPDAAVPEPIGALLLLTAMTAIVSDLRVTRRGRA